MQTRTKRHPISARLSILNPIRFSIVNTPTPVAPDSPFARYTRRTLIVCVIAIPLLITASVLLRKSGRWSLANWAHVGLIIAIVLGALSALGRLAHALWASTQYVLGELMLTFFAAAVVSLALIEWVKYDPTELRSAREMRVYTIAIVSVTFMLFLSGSAWAWGLLRRAQGIPLSRIGVLASGWVAAIGVMCFVAFLLFALVFALIGTATGPAGKFYLYLIPGCLLVIPGILVERKVRRHFSATPAPPPSAPTPSPPSAP